MNLEICFTPAELAGLDFAGRTVVVADVLRATSTMIAAVASGARAVYPVASIEEAIQLAQRLGRAETVLSGERRCLPIEGFDLGNSPREFTPAQVQGRAVVMSTTNGTGALLAASPGARVLVGALVNRAAVVREVAGAAELVIVCAGREGRFALEDALFAALLRGTAAGRQIAAAGLEPDIAHCAGLDLQEIVPIFRERQVTA